MISLLVSLWGGLSWGCDVIVDATVHTPDGPRDGWDVVWEDGEITAVGPDAPRPPGCTEHHGSKWQVTAGFVAPLTPLGLVEVELEASTRDDAWGDDPVRAALRPSLVFNPRSAVIPVTRLGGITSAVIAPSGGLVSGQAAWVTLDGGVQSDSVVAPSVAMVADLRGLGNRAAALVRLRELIDDTRWYIAHGSGRERDVLEGLSASRTDLDALVPVAKGQLPLVVRAERASDLEALLVWADEVDVKLVIVGAAEGWLVADRLAAAKVAVAIDPFVYGPGSYDQIHGRADNAALLHAAGVPLMFVSGEPQNQRALRFIAGNAVRAGLPHQAALAALSSTPAWVFGQSDRGSLRVGAVADLAVWTGDPLDVSGRLAGLWIDGKEVPRTSRQTELVEAWRTLPQSRYPSALPSGAKAP